MKSDLKAVDAGKSGTTVSVGEDVNTTPENNSSDPSSTVPAQSETGKHLHTIIHYLDVTKVKNN